MTTDVHAAPTEPAPPLPRSGRSVGRAVRVGIGLLLIAGGVALALWYWGDGLTAVEVTETTHDPRDRVVLDLEANGDVRVATHDADEIVVEQRTERLLASVEVDQRVEGDALHLTSSRCGRGVLALVRRCSASFVVAVPAGTEVAGSVGHGEVVLRAVAASEVRTGHGRVEVAGATGDLDLRTGHGAVVVTGTTGDVTVDTGHGGVTIDDVDGRVEATTGHGPIHLRRIGGSVSAESGHGAIDVATTTGETITLTSGHGTIDLAPATPPISARLRTSHGGVHVLLPDGVPPYAVATDAGGASVDVGIATDPAAEHRLEVTTGHGTIDIASAG